MDNNVKNSSDKKLSFGDYNLRVALYSIAALVASKVEAKGGQNFQDLPADSAIVLNVSKEQQWILDMLPANHPSIIQIKNAIASLENWADAKELTDLYAWSKTISQSTKAPPAAKEKARRILEILESSVTPTASAITPNNSETTTVTTENIADTNQEEKNDDKDEIDMFRNMKNWALNSHMKSSIGGSYDKKEKIVTLGIPSPDKYDYISHEEMPNNTPDIKRKGFIELEWALEEGIELSIRIRLQEKKWTFIDIGETKIQVPEWSVAHEFEWSVPSKVQVLNKKEAWDVVDVEIKYFTIDILIKTGKDTLPTRKTIMIKKFSL